MGIRVRIERRVSWGALPIAFLSASWDKVGARQRTRKPILPADTHRFRSGLDDSGGEPSMTQYPNQPYGSAPAGVPVGGLDVEKVKQNALIAMIVGFLCGGMIPGILGLLGYLKADTETATAKKLTKWAWISFGIMWALMILTWVAVILLNIFVFAAVGTTTTY